MITIVSRYDEVVATLGEGGATVTSGYGGWQEIPRPRQKSFMDWQGRAPFRLAVPFLLDGFVDERSVEGEFAAIERMGTVQAGDSRPARIKIIGPVPHSDLDWVIEALEWGEALYRADGSRVRQAGSLALVEFAEEDLIVISPAQAARAKAGTRNPTKARQRRYVVRAGDTLGRIAAKQLGNSARWREIAKLNNIRDPNNIKVGRTILLP